MANQDIPEVDIQSMLGEETPPASDIPYVPRKVVLDAFSVPPQINDVLDKLRRWDTGCVDVAVDFRQVVFTATEEDMCITPEAGTYIHKPVYFMKDMDDSSSPKIVHSQKQFCRILGIPHGFFTKNRPSLRMNIVRTWQAGLQANDKKAQGILRLRDGQDCGVLRAILNPSSVPLKTSEVLISTLHGLDKNARVLFVSGDGQDDLVFHIRLLIGQPYELVTGQSIELGIALTASELGACPLFFDVFVKDVTTGACFVPTYAGEPFFTSKYVGLQHTDLVDLLTKVAGRVAQEAPEIITVLSTQTAPSTTFEMRSEFHRLSQSRGLTSQYRQALYHQMNEAKDQICTPYDVACQAALVAQSLDTLKRLEAERRIGQYLNMVFTSVT